MGKKLYTGNTCRKSTGGKGVPRAALDEAALRGRQAMAPPNHPSRYRPLPPLMIGGAATSAGQTITPSSANSGDVSEALSRAQQNLGGG